MTALVSGSRDAAEFDRLVLTLREDRIAPVTSFIGADHFPAFGLFGSIGAGE